jgi:hypothetical protein
MKVDGITLLQMIRDGKIKPDTKLKSEDRYYKVTGYKGIFCCDEDGYFGGDDEIYARVLLEHDFEIIEEENKEIKELKLEDFEGLGCMELHEVFNNKINELVRAVNNLIKE